MNFENFTDNELWELLNGICATLQTYERDPNGNVFMFWYNLFKCTEKEIDKRLLAEY